MHNNFKTWLKRISILIIELFILISVNILIKIYNDSILSPKEIIFELPLPEDIIEKYGLDPYPEIEKVIVAGFFSDWNPEDENYKMTQISSNKWKIKLPFEPGDNQYKFVIYQKEDTTPYWVHDKNAKIQVSDSFGGYNSVVRIPSTREISIFLNAILGGLFLITILYYILIPVSYWILHLKIKFRDKIILSLFIISILSNIVLIVYNNIEIKNIIKQDIIDSINLVHNILLSENISIKEINNKEVINRIQNTIKKFFWKARTRVEINKHSNIQITLSDILLFNDKLELLTTISRKENYDLQNSRAKKYGFKDINDYFTNGVFIEIIQKGKKNKIKNLLTMAINKKYLKHETPQTRNSIFFLGYNIFLYPINIGVNTIGYYGGIIQTKLFGKEIQRILIMNIYLIIITGIVTILILSNIGKAITSYLNTLIEWTEEIIKGNFNNEKIIKSNDEIQKLAENFNKMRNCLKTSFELIEENNRKLIIEAYVDKLTGLPNRKKLLADIEKKNYYNLILINIDSFQEINDLYGHEVGDFILKEVGARLKELLIRDNQKLYKIGVDEYIILIEGKSERRELEIFGVYFCDGIVENTYIYMDNEIYISVAAGISYLTDEEVNLSPKQYSSILLTKADMALKRAKNSQIRFAIYDETMAIIRQYELNILWTKKLRSALKENRIVPYYQPIINNKTMQIEKYECLVRMIEKDGSIITPNNFLKISKKARFYRFITKIIIEKSFEKFKNTNYEFSINLSIEDIMDYKTQEYILDKLSENPDVSRRVVFEIVETEGIENYEYVKDFIEKIKQYNSKIAIDDFGTGYSNFEHILQLHIDYIKIDATLIKNMDKDINSQIITKTISNFAKDLKIKTIAEYVHSEEIFKKVKELDIDYSQGYYFGEPKLDIKN